MIPGETGKIRDEEQSGQFINRGSSDKAREEELTTRSSSRSARKQLFHEEESGLNVVGCF